MRRSYSFQAWITSAGTTAKMTRMRILPVKPIRTPDQRLDRRSPSFIWAGPPPAIRLTRQSLGEPSALDGWRAEMVTLQVAEALCPRDRFVRSVLHPFRYGDAAETVDWSEQIPQKGASLVTVRQVSHKRTVDLDRVD